MRLAFYGDDFTGSTDALEQLSLAGWRTRLFIGLPDAATLAACDDLDAVGIAGITRSLPPEDMAAELRPAFEALRALAPQHVHYKVCSTFDSSPETGSIGKAIEIGVEIFPNAWVPLLVAAPALGRYSVFGNLFARVGIGSEGAIHRLDRHPSMSRHPTTPAHESDLRLHLARQTKRRCGLIDVLDLSRPDSEITAKIKRLRTEGFEIMLFDALEDAHIARVGRLLEAITSPGATLFSVGSSSIEKALASRYAGTHFPPSATPKPRGPLLVLSGSRSPTTAAQIRHALKHGFAEEALDVPRILDSATRASTLAQSGERVLAHLRAGRNALLHTAALDEAVGGAVDSARLLGEALGHAAETILGSVDVRRIVLAGGDTSGHAIRTLGLDSVEMAAPLWPGAPLCRACSRKPFLNGLEVVLKGGQVGDNRFFTLAAGMET